MIQSILLDNDISVINTFKEIQHNRQSISFEGNVAPEGYTRSEDFRKRAVEIVNTFCDRHDIL
jgi:hypothetical protein